MQKHVNLVDLVKSFPTNILLQNLSSIQRRMSPVKFAHLAEKSENGSISNLSTKVQGPVPPYVLSTMFSAVAQATTGPKAKRPKATPSPGKAHAPRRTGLNHLFGTKKYCHQIRTFFSRNLQFCFCNISAIINE